MTKIEWTTRTWNPIRARNLATEGVGHYCQKVSEGCKNCYAERMQPRFRNWIQYDAASLARVELFLDPDVLREPERWRKPQMVFVCSMTDLFGEFVPDRWVEDVLQRTTEISRHTYQVLTKRPERIVLRMPSNTWLGISAENQQRLSERLPHLQRADAATKFLSLEPLLSPILLPIDHGVNWVIVGGESGLGARECRLEWIESIVEQCRQAKLPCFVKQLGSAVGSAAGMKHPKGGDPAEWPEALRVREWPRARHAETQCR